MNVYSFEVTRTSADRAHLIAESMRYVLCSSYFHPEIAEIAVAPVAGEFAVTVQSEHPDAADALKDAVIMTLAEELAKRDAEIKEFRRRGRPRPAGPATSTADAGATRRRTATRSPRTCTRWSTGSRSGPQRRRAPTPRSANGSSRWRSAESDRAATGATARGWIWSSGSRPCAIARSPAAGRCSTCQLAEEALKDYDRQHKVTP